MTNINAVRTSSADVLGGDVKGLLLLHCSGEIERQKREVRRETAPRGATDDAVLLLLLLLLLLRWFGFVVKASKRTNERTNERSKSKKQ